MIVQMNEQSDIDIDIIFTIWKS